MVGHSPVANEQFNIEPGKAREKFVGDLSTSVEEDWQALQPLRERMAKFYRRAYLLNREQVNQPWVGASNVQLPIEDKYKARMFGSMRSLLGFGSTQFAQVRPGDSNSLTGSANMEMYLNSVLRGDYHVYSQSNWSSQANLLIESFLQHGFGFLRPEYIYATEVGHREIRKGDLPGLLAFIHFAPNASDGERLMIQAADEQSGVMSNPPEVVAIFGEEINPVTRDIFDRHKDTFKRLVSEGFDLDYDDPLEGEACDEIMRWMRAGARDSLVVLMRSVVEDHPALTYVEPHRLIAPPKSDSSPDISLAYRVSEIMPMTEDRLRQFGRDMGWSRQAVDRAAGSIGCGHAFRRAQDELFLEMEERSGEANIITTDSPEGDTVEIIRTLSRRKHKGAYVRTEAYYEPESGELLSYRTMPYNLPGWNYVRFAFEERERGIYSPRGLPETIEEQSKYITATHRSAQNARVISTSRGYFLDERLGIDEDDPFWGPSMVKNVSLKGARVPSIDAAIKEIAPQPGAAQEWTSEEFFHQAMIDDHLGEAGTMVRDARLLEPITATEAMDRRNISSQVSSVRGGIVVDAFTKALSMMAAYARQFVADRVPVTDSTGVRWLTRDDIRGNHIVRAAAAVGDMSPEFRAERALRRLSVMAQMTQARPDLEQDERFRVSFFAAFEEWLREDDPEAATRILQPRSQEEIQALIEGSQQAQQQAEQMQALQGAAAQAEVDKLVAEADKLRAEAAAKLAEGVRGA